MAEFKPARDQRQAINRWNRYVLGENYTKEASRLYPKSKEYVPSVRMLSIMLVGKFALFGLPPACANDANFPTVVLLVY